MVMGYPRFRKIKQHASLEHQQRMVVDVQVD
jgi:hypothetical protein